MEMSIKQKDSFEQMGGCANWEFELK